MQAAAEDRQGDVQERHPPREPPERRSDLEHRGSSLGKVNARIIMGVIAFAALVYGVITFDGAGRLVMLVGAVAAAARVAYEVRDERRPGRGAQDVRR